MQVMVYAKTSSSLQAGRGARGAGPREQVASRVLQVGLGGGGGGSGGASGP
jgi:hypothetical protein